MSGDVVARARESLAQTNCTDDMQDFFQVGLVRGLVTEVEKLRAENARWLLVAELLDAESPAAAETEIACLGLSIHLGQWGEWGRETLEALFLRGALETIRGMTGMRDILDVIERSGIEP